MRTLLAVLVVSLVAAGSFWAGRVTLEEPEPVAQANESMAVVEVVEQQLGRVLTLTTTVRRASAPLAVNRLAGVVTTVGQGGEVASGEVLYAVRGVPVRVVPGEVPFHRDLAPGISGPDVTQLQHHLVGLGLGSFEPNGKFGPQTTAAVKAWQKASGLPQSSAIALGELIAVPQLPVQVRPLPVVRAVDQDEYMDAQIRCMQEAGWINESEVPGEMAHAFAEAQEQVYREAQYQCSAQYPLKPKYYQRFNDAQLRARYAHHVGPLSECLATEGYPPPEPPSLRSTSPTTEVTSPHGGSPMTTWRSTITTASRKHAPLSPRASTTSPPSRTNDSEGGPTASTGWAAAPTAGTPTRPSGVDGGDPAARPAPPAPGRPRRRRHPTRWRTARTRPIWWRRRAPAPG